ncbi:MAG: hypothetical protein AB9856_03595 [Cellulosilyticaceae bacterium]
MERLIIPVNFDNHPELYKFVQSKGNKAEFVRNCIAKEMYQEKISKESNVDLENTIEKVIKRCLKECNISVQYEKSISEEVEAAANFFDED